MSVDVTELLMTPSTIGSLLAGVGALGSIVAGATLLVPKISRKLMPLPKESRLDDFLPFEAMMADGKTITTKRGDLVQNIRIAGAELQVTNENEHRAIFTTRNTWLSTIAERPARARVFKVRKIGRASGGEGVCTSV